MVLQLSQSDIFRASVPPPSSAGYADDKSERSTLALYTEMTDGAQRVRRCADEAIEFL